MRKRGMRVPSDVAADAGFDNSDYRIAGDVRNPYPELALARASTPVLANDAMSPDADAAGAFTVFRYDDVSHVLRDNHSFSNKILAEAMSVMGEKLMLGMDLPEHRVHRSLVATAFRPSTIVRWEESLVTNVVDELIDAFVDRHEAELVREFTFLFPTQVVAGVLGLPRADFEQFQRWTVAIINSSVEHEKGRQSSNELKEYLAAILEDRRRDPKDDLISDLAHASLDGEELPDEEIFSFLRLILPAGVETTFRASGSLLFLLFTHRDQLDAVRSDRSLIPQAIEEGLRYEAPLLITARVATADLEIRGVRIPKGSIVSPVLGAANRDPDRFEDPDTFDIFREPHQHMTFGTGPHMCLAQHLARMETRVALNRLFDRLPNLRLDEERVERDDVHIHGEIWRSPTSLPVLWD
jgi:cytochrome P450